MRADLRALDHHLARIERWIEHDVIGGEQPNAADLQIGAGLALLLTVEDVARVVGSRPAVELARRWFPGYPGHVPAGALRRGARVAGGSVGNAEGAARRARPEARPAADPTVPSAPFPAAAAAPRGAPRRRPAPHRRPACRRAA